MFWPDKYESSCEDYYKLGYKDSGLFYIKSNSKHKNRITSNDSRNNQMPKVVKCEFTGSGEITTVVAHNIEQKYVSTEPLNLSQKIRKPQFRLQKSTLAILMA